MSRRRKQPLGLLGANGQPIGWQPKPRPILGMDSKPITRVEPPTRLPSMTVLVKSMAGPPLGDSLTMSAMYRSLTSRYLDLFEKRIVGESPTAPKSDPYAGLDELLVGLEGMTSGVQELPEGTKDMTSYHDAFAAAVKACRHPNYEDTMYAKREAKCNDCGKYFVKPKGMFGW